jgi:hypothetical protein
MASISWHCDMKMLLWAIRWRLYYKLSTDIFRHVVFPKDTKVKIPFLVDFVSKCVTTIDSTYISMQELFHTYVSYIQKRTSDQLSLTISNSYRSFTMQFKRLASQQWFRERMHGQRGYYVRMTKCIRHRPSQSAVVPFTQRVASSLKTTTQERLLQQILWKDRFLLNTYGRL